MIEPAIDLVSACYLFVIIIGIHYIKEENDGSTNAYIYCCLACFTGLIIDAIPFIISGWVHNDSILSLANYLAFIWLDILLAAYSYYLVALIKEKTGRFSKRVLLIMWGLCALDCVFLTLGVLTGHIFSFENEQFIQGSWPGYVTVLPTFYCLSISIIYLGTAKLSVSGIGSLSAFTLFCRGWSRCCGFLV